MPSCARGVSKVIALSQLAAVRSRQRLSSVTIASPTTSGGDHEKAPSPAPRVDGARRRLKRRRRAEFCDHEGDHPPAGGLQLVVERALSTRSRDGASDA